MAQRKRGGFSNAGTKSEGMIGKGSVPNLVSKATKGVKAKSIAQMGWSAFWAKSLAAVRSHTEAKRSPSDGVCALPQQQKGSPGQF